MPGPVAAAAPTVSVIVLSRGRESLAAALVSIAAQDHPHGEVIVVAMSAAQHAAVADRCGAYPVRFVAADAPRDPPAAANAGVAAASGEWITFLDDADVFLPGQFTALVRARDTAPDAGVVHSFARVVMPDGTARRYGHPFSLAQLYADSFIPLAAAIVHRRLFDGGCRFDETLPMHYDWDLFLQVAQVTTFRFVAREGFQWNIAGRDGAREADFEDVSARCRDLVFAKWQGKRDALIDAVEPMLRSAAEWSQHGDHLAAEACCQDVLAMSPNDPWALNLLASIQRATGRSIEARRTQESAVAMRPEDPALIFNLALLARAQGDLELARRCCDQAIALDADFAPAARLRAELAR